MIDEILMDAELKMDSAIEYAKEEFAAIRTGRAHPAMFSKLVVDYYGAATPLQQRLARVSRVLLYLCLGIVALTAAVGVARGLGAVEVFLWTEYDLNAGVVLPIFGVVNFVLAGLLIVGFGRVMSATYERFPKRPTLVSDIDVPLPEPASA